MYLSVVGNGTDGLARSKRLVMRSMRAQRKNRIEEAKLGTSAPPRRKCGLQGIGKRPRRFALHRSRRQRRLASSKMLTRKLEQKAALSGAPVQVAAQGAFPERAQAYRVSRRYAQISRRSDRLRACPPHLSPTAVDHQRVIRDSAISMIS